MIVCIQLQCADDSVMVMKCYDVVLSAAAADAESTELSIPL